MSNCVVSAEDNVIRPIVPIRVINSSTKKSCFINCMIDTGADRDVISIRTVNRLNLATKSTEMRVVTVDNEFSSKRNLASFTIESVNGIYSADVIDALVGNVLTSENDIPPAQRDLSMHPHLESIPFDNVYADVEMIMGAAHTDAWMPTEIKRGKNNDLAAMKSSLGWTIVGKLGRRSPEGVSINAISVEDEILRKKFDRIFYHDFAVVSEEELGESKENIDAINQLAASVKFDKTVGKYSVGLPWNRPREEVVSILNSVNSRAMAMRRLKGMIPRFRRDNERKERVFAEVQKFVDTGVAVEIDGVDDDAIAQKPRWYLPLHVVEKGGKTRVCHDARSSAGGVCLNDFLLGGPNLVNPLAEILMFARMWKFVIMNDIKAFFHQIRVDEEDVDAFRFPWFTDGKLDEAKLMSFLAHVFGSGASSVATAFVLRFHADVIRPRYPENVYDMIRNRYYVDDGTGGADTEQDTIDLSSNVNKAMAEGGFQLCKFKSNLPQIMEGNPNAEVKLTDKNDDDDAVKVLGVSWIPSTDVFTFNFDPEIANKEINTPRELTSVQSSIYDPLGLISPFRLPGRHMLQRCGAQKNGWDSRLDSSLKDNFQKWARSIPELAKLKIPRWWNCGIDCPVDEQLHLFADAAPSSGFGAAAYRRVKDSEGNVKVILLCSRSHVVPLNAARASHHNSTPRLELTASEKAVELRLFVQRSTQRSFTSVTMWSDSEATLKMINDKKSRFRLFFANRLSKIHSGSSTNEWRYVDSENNPADYTSRGIAAHEVEKWEIFHYGPKFLYKDEIEWPKTNIHKIQAVNINAIATLPPQKPVSKFLREVTAKCSTWYAKRKRIATLVLIVKRWRESTKAKTRTARLQLPNVAAINISRMDQAEKLLIKEIQSEHFGQDIDVLTKNSVTSSEVRNSSATKSKSLRPHNPFIDEEGILRVGSRLLHADLQFETKFPIILPPKDEVVISIIRHFHQVLLHAGPKQTLAALREKYWINKGLQSVKSTIFHCVDCQKLFKAPLTQKMAPLPVRRVNLAAPFQNSGVDLAGPFEVKMNGRANHKVWISVFTCCTTRAVHAEIVYKLDADSMINAITRFSSRRPGVEYLISDRGTNLVGADAIMRKEMESWNSSVNPELRRKGIEWEFIPAGTPHYGGFWERIVSLFKKHIISATKGEIFHVDVFNTIVIEAEGIINRRPLIASSDDPRDTEAISPANILYPATFSHSSAVIIPEQQQKNSIRFAWQRAQSRVNAFWKSWSADYLAILHHRPKWQKSMRDLQVDDLVIIVDETVKRHEWKMARVITVHKKENHVRNVTVIRSDGKKILKDRNKLVLLELTDDPSIKNG